MGTQVLVQGVQAARNYMKESSGVVAGKPKARVKHNSGTLSFICKDLSLSLVLVVSGSKLEFY